MKKTPILFHINDENYKQAKKIANENKVSYRSIFLCGLEYVKEMEERLKIELKTIGYFKAFLSFHVAHDISKKGLKKTLRPCNLNIFNTESKKYLEICIQKGEISESGKSFKFIYSYIDEENKEEVIASNTMPLRHVKKPVLRILGLGG